MKLPKVNEKQVQALLEKYHCQTPYHEVRTLFLGRIASPTIAVSPMQTLKDLWGGQLPPFETMDDLNQLIDALINRLWNSLTAHQKPTSPFKLTKLQAQPNQAGLTNFTKTRLQEIDGFVNGLFGDQNEIQLPEAATKSLDILSQLRAMLAGALEIVRDSTKPVSDVEANKTLKMLQELNPIIETEINAVVISCASARQKNFLPPKQPKMH